MSLQNKQVKTCSKCKVEKHVDEFYLSSEYKKPQNPCKQCASAYQEQRRKHPETRVQILARKKRYRQRPDVRARAREHNQRPEVKEARRLYAQKPEVKAKAKEYNNRPEIIQRNLEYFAIRNEHLRQITKDKRCAKPVTQKERNSIKRHNRRARKLALPNTLTTAEWQHALNYFNGCCAVCGRQLNDMFGEFTAAADHWIPLSYNGAENPGTTKFNIVPLCHGIGGCNCRKQATMPDVWLDRKFSKKKAAQIKTRIQKYFDSLQ